MQLKDTINPYERVIFFIENFQLISIIFKPTFTPPLYNFIIWHIDQNNIARMKIITEGWIKLLTVIATPVRSAKKYPLFLPMRFKAYKYNATAKYANIVDAWWLVVIWDETIFEGYNAHKRDAIIAIFLCISFAIKKISPPVMDVT